jgi:tRNA(Ile)-lysidine synthase
VKKQVLKTIKENKMFEANDKVIVGVSGGPDSMCLLNILNKLKAELKIEIAVAHVNHCLRGEASDNDEKYVQSYCSKNEIPFYSKKIDINKIAEERNISCETAGRVERYKFFKELLLELKFQKIALAHNANDQAETVLMRIMRGTGLEGITGIKPVRDKTIVRPILEVKRDEIEKYCSDNNLIPRIDKTNFESIYTRNKIRLQLIPFMKENFNPEIIEAVNRLASTLRIDNEYLELLARQKYECFCEIKPEKIIIKREAFDENISILTRIIRQALLKKSGNLLNFGKVHVYDIIKIQKQTTGSLLTLPNSINVINNYGDIEIICAKEKGGELDNFSYKLQLGENHIPKLNLNISLKLIKGEEILDFNAERLTKYFNYDRINGDIVLRNKMDGDKIIPLGMHGSKKLKSIFIDLKLPREKRNKIPLLTFNGEIAWIIGCKVSETFKIDKNTNNIIEVKIESGDII